MLTRRDFVRAAAASTAALVVRPGFAAALGPAPRDADDGRALVLVELTGGNDGLNTLVPFADDRYHRARPALRHRPEAVHRIDDALGYAPALGRLAALHKDGFARVELGVGMTRPDRSHFESLDRWHTGDGAPDGRAEGWLGRALPAIAGDGALPAVALGERTPVRIFSGAPRPVPTCGGLRELAPSEAARRFLKSAAFEAVVAARPDAADRALDRAARDLGDRLDALLKRDVSAAKIPGNDLGRKLEDAWRLLNGACGTRAVFVRTGGFDTHARQDLTHGGLLGDVDAALAPFVRALKSAGRLDDVLVVVYSEFGRRVAENGSRGTDHGSAGPALLYGGGLSTGVFGERPNLADLDDGDVRATTDFRRLPATALRHLGHPRPRDVVAGDPL